MEQRWSFQLFRNDKEPPRLSNRACRRSASNSSLRVPALALVGALALSPSALAQIIIDLGTVPNCTEVYAAPRALSADGTTAGGITGCEGFKYIYPSGTISAGVNVGDVSALSADGTVGIGSAGFSGGYHAAGLLPGNVVNDLGILAGYTTSYGYGLSGDAVVAAGQCYRSSPPGSRAFRWTFSTGMQDLGTLGGDLAYAIAVSRDGSAIVGASTLANGYYHATRWRQEFANQDLGALFAGYESSARAVNPDGSIVVGFAYTPTGYHGFRWTAQTGMQDLGIVAAGGNASSAACLSDDGLAVGGSIGPYGATLAAVWTETFGWTDLNALLPTMGVNLSNWQLTSLNGISSSGTVLVGSGVHNGIPRAWMVRGISPICGPRIVTQPASVAVCTGLSAGFDVFAFPPEVGAGITFHWARRYVQGDGEVNIIPLNNGSTGSGSVITGATYPNLGISPAGPADAGQYVCYISAGCGSAYTVPVTLSVVTQPPGITGAPVSKTKCLGGTVSFSASAGPASAAPFAVTWKKGGVPINLNNPRFTVSTNSNGSNSTLTITNVQLSDAPTAAGGYTCLFENPCGGLPAGPANLTVYPDFGGTGGVDTYDLTLLLGNMGATVTPYTNGDINGDGLVNTADLVLLLDAFGKGCP